MTADLDLIRHSVTRADHSNGVSPGSPWHILVGPVGALHQVPGLPAGWSHTRDVVLTATLDMEDMWQSSCYKAITKTVARGFDIKDTNDSERRSRRYQQMLLRFDGTRYVPGMSKVLQNFLLTDNGAFVEVVRASKASGSRILGLMHLDSFRCTRTDDPQRPVIYRDNNGYEHELRDHQVLTFVDMPSPQAGANSTGRCAATRAFRTIIKLAAVEIYFREKVTGDRNLAIHIVNGITTDQLQSSLATAQAEKERRGFVYYKGSVVIPAIKMDADLSVVTIPLAEIPDGFDVDQVLKDGYLRYANALGMPVQDIQPLAGQGLGTGTQTVILAEEAEGQGLAAFHQDWEHALNEFVLPESTTFHLTNTHDVRDQKATAEVALLRAQERAARIASGEISPQMARQLALDAGDLPREMLANDATAAGDIADDEKPVNTTLPDLSALFPAPTAPPGQQAAPPPARAIVKEVDEYAQRLQAAIDARDAGLPVPTVPYTGLDALINTKAKRLTVADLDEKAALEAARALLGEVRG